MQMAIDVAKEAWGNTHPNPMVGAVVVLGNDVLAVGYHHKAGQPHAEPMALNQLEGVDLSKATLYVTLEPCCTFGKTPPCTERIKRAGVGRVVMGTLDPNPDHAGRAIQILQDAGIEVVHNVLKDQCDDLNLIFNHWIVKGSPFIAGKIASTLDGRIATRSGHSKWITGEVARTDVHHWRRCFPAIGAGSGTVLADNPSLTVRHGYAEEWCPIRFVFDRSLRTLEKPNLNVYSDEFAEKTIVVTTADADKVPSEVHSNIRDVWTLSGNNFWGDFRQKCAESFITGVYLEGGSMLLSDALKNGQLDYLFHYQAPKLLADASAKPMLDALTPNQMSEALTLKEVKHSALGDDRLVRGFLS